MRLAAILADQVVIMFLLLAVGVILYRIRMITSEGNKQIAGIVLYIVAPLLILDTYCMPYDAAITKNMLLGFLLSGGSICAGILFSNLLRIRGDKKKLSTERFTVIFVNCGFMGIPLAQAVFGGVGVMYCTTYITMFNLFVWTYGLALMRGKNKGKSSFFEKMKPFLTPTMLCIVVGLFIYFLRIPVPKQVKSAVSYLASMNTPLAMIVSGVYIAESKIFSALRHGRIYFVSFMKCFLFPLVVLLLLLPLPLNTELKTTILILSACPSGANGMLFASRFGGDQETASHVFALTTVACVAFIPIIVVLFEWFGRIIS